MGKAESLGAVEAFSPQQINNNSGGYGGRQSAVTKVLYQVSGFQALCPENTKSEFQRETFPEKKNSGEKCRPSQKEEGLRLDSHQGTKQGFTVLKHGLSWPVQLSHPRGVCVYLFLLHFPLHIL